ncbi:MAG TPA: hypothetical protein HA302_08265 [Thermococcaceae archaeon]|nr:hypothetical protein [Thermococcaceae archaeon]
MRDFGDNLRFAEKLMWVLVGMTITSPLWLYYLLVKSVHTYLLQTLGISNDPIGFIRLSSILLASLGMLIPLYELTNVLNDISGAWERYGR